MFEPPLKAEPSTNKGIWIGAAVVVLVAAAVLIYVERKSSASKPAPAPAAAAVVKTNQKPDPVKDLHVVSAEMSKDSSGTIAQWVVDIQNNSTAYAYSGISYQTTYVGGDNNVLSQNTGVIHVSIGPNGEQTATFNDVQYPAGTSWYRFQITNAKATPQAQ
jgi:hypothetical protein